MATTDNTVVRDDGSWITDEFLQEILQELHPAQEIFIVDKDIKFAVGKGENYLSILFRIRVRYKPGNNEKIETHHLIAKGYPDGEFIRKFITDSGVFDRELSIYHTALPEIYRFSQQRLQNGQVPRNSAISYPTSRSNTVVLEDLKYQGFIMVDRRNLLDLQHCQLVVKNLARLHGMSAAFHQHNPNILDKYTQIMVGEKNRGDLEQFVIPQLECLLKTIQSWVGFETYAVKIEKYIPIYLDRLIEDCTPKQGGFHVLCHGDCWINNYLFKYSLKGEVTDMRFVDFQLSHWGTPALDLSHFLYSSSQDEVKASNMDQLLEEYHTQLCETLASLGCNADTFSFQDLKNEMKRVASFGFFIITNILPTILADADDTPDLAELTEENIEEVGQWTKLHKNPRFKKSFQQVLPYLDELGVFD